MSPQPRLRRVLPLVAVAVVIVWLVYRQSQSPESNQNVEQAPSTSPPRCTGTVAGLGEGHCRLIGVWRYRSPADRAKLVAAELRASAAPHSTHQWVIDAWWAELNDVHLLVVGHHSLMLGTPRQVTQVSTYRIVRQSVDAITMETTPSSGAAGRLLTFRFRGAALIVPPELRSLLGAGELTYVGRQMPNLRATIYLESTIPTDCVAAAPEGSSPW